ncbi:MAG: ATP-binding protein [Armatimonadetes bacterium]|nr:ATP-binding protein [Armatimonadota bacterium]
MEVSSLISLVLCVPGLLIALAGMASRRRQFPDPAAVLASAMFLWCSQAASNLAAPALGPEAVQLANHLTTLVPALLTITLLGYIYEYALARWREAQRHLAAVLAAVPSVVAGLDDAGRVVFCNRAKGLADLSPNLASADVNVAERLGLRPWPPHTTVTAERTLRGAEGVPRTWLATACPVTPPLRDGSVGISCFVDITELHQLRQQVARLERLETAGVLAAGVAHELNNQLMAILVHAEALFQRTGDDPAMQDAARVVLSAAGRARRMVSHLTRLAHPAKGLTMSWVNVREIVEETTRLVRPALGPGVILTVDCSTDLPQVWADPDALHQVTLNLLLNARDAVGERGKISVRLYITAHALPDRYASAGNKGVIELSPCLALEVEDDGPGMDRAVARQVFSPFFSAKSSGPGLGLGLAVSYALISAHGGDITVDSAPGQGAKFTVFLPLKPRAGNHASRPQPARAARKILLVEDERALLTALAAALTSRGFTVATAASGQEALRRAAATDHFDALVLDLVLPDNDGLQLADTLAPKHPGARIFLVTAYPSDYIRAEAARRGIKVLPKPACAEAICAALVPGTSK